MEKRTNLWNICLRKLHWEIAYRLLNESLGWSLLKVVNTFFKNFSNHRNNNQWRRLPMDKYFWIGSLYCLKIHCKKFRLHGLYSKRQYTSMYNIELTWAFAILLPKRLWIFQFVEKIKTYFSTIFISILKLSAQYGCVELRPVEIFYPQFLHVSLSVNLWS